MAILRDAWCYWSEANDAGEKSNLPVCRLGEILDVVANEEGWAYRPALRA
jgi:hypothetical protein